MSFSDLYVEGNTGGGARWWKASEFTGAHAILIEVKDFKTNVPKSKPQVRVNQQTGQAETITHEDVAFANITVFDEPGDLAAGNGTEYLNVKINQTYLAKDLADFVGKALVKRVTTPPTKSYLVWRQVEPDVVQAVGKYYDAREAKAKAITEQLDAAGEDGLPEWARG